MMITQSYFTFRNSWGPNWGKNGNGYMPYDCILNADLAFDFYVIAKSKINLDI